MAFVLTQPPTFPKHSQDYFYCWCIPRYHVYVNEAGKVLALEVLHFQAKDA